MERKEEILRQAGYWYNFDRMAYVNRVAKKAFSIEYVDDHPEEWLADRIAEVGDVDEWLIYTNEELSPRVHRDLVTDLDGQRANR